MGTDFKELKRLTFQKLKKPEGDAMLAVEQGINEAQKNIARVRDFDELIVLDTSHALTVADKKLYHIVDDLKLVRPKDIFTIRYMDGANSRKLTYIPVRELDERVPYTEMVGTGRPTYYTRRGKYLEFFRIPNAAKPLYILHSQWPDTLVDETDETPYLDMDDVITTLAADIAFSIVEEGIPTNWVERARELLGIALKEETTQPDVFYVAKPFSAKPIEVIGEYWTNPWVKKQP